MAEEIEATVSSGKVVFELTSLSPIGIVLPMDDPDDLNGDGYHDGDVAVINGIIENNGLAWTADDPGSWPENILPGIKWNDDVPKRVEALMIMRTNLTGELDVSGLSEMGQLTCYSNNLTAIDVFGCINLTEIHCSSNYLPMPEGSGIVGVQSGAYLGYLPQKPVPAPVTGVVSPVGGTAAQTVINGGAGYTASLSWNGNPDVFDYETVYTATITLTAKENYTFDHSDAFMSTEQIAGFTVNGIEPHWVANNVSVSETLVFTVSFPKTGEHSAPVNISDAVVTVSGTYTYTGSPIEPGGSGLAVVLGGDTLVYGDDYTLSYENNIDAGTATVTVTGTGDYTGTTSQTFVIGKASRNAPSAPSVDSKTTTSISFQTLDGGMEYRISTGTRQGSPVFTGLEPDTNYDFYARLKENANYEPSAEVGPISVRTEALPPSEVLVTGISITGGNSISTKSGNLQLTAQITPEDATNKTIVWSVESGDAFASVNSTGFVTAKANGTAIIRVTAADGSGVYGEITITISGQSSAGESDSDSGGSGGAPSGNGNTNTDNSTNTNTSNDASSNADSGDNETEQSESENPIDYPADTSEEQSPASESSANADDEGEVLALDEDDVPLAGTEEKSDTFPWWGWLLVVVGIAVFVGGFWWYLAIRHRKEDSAQ